MGFKSVAGLRCAVGGYTYLLEILTGIVGSRIRWRTTPWLVVLFGLMIAPLVIGTWSTIALIGAAAVLIQIPYSLDELLATLQFLRRRAKAGQNWLRVLFVGDTDEMRVTQNAEPITDKFDQSPGAVIKSMVGGGRQPTVEPGSGTTHWPVATVHAHYARRRWQPGECPPRDRLARRAASASDLAYSPVDLNEETTWTFIPH